MSSSEVPLGTGYPPAGAPPPPPPAPPRVPPPPRTLAPLLLGTELVMIAMTTTWFSWRPEVISIREGSEAPVWTGTDFGWPLTRSVTALPVAVVWTALVGTVST